MFLKSTNNKQPVSHVCRILSIAFPIRRSFLPHGPRLLVWLATAAISSVLPLAVEAAVTIRYVDQLPAEPGSAWDGEDGGEYSGAPGTGKGYATIKAALAAMSAGDHIYLRNGTYVEGRIVIPDKNGTSWKEGEYNYMASYPGEWAVLDGENNLPNVSNTFLLGSSRSINYWKFERLEFTRAVNTNKSEMRGFYANTGPFIFRYCYFHDNICDMEGANPTALGGQVWNNSTVEYCYFKNNGSHNKIHHNFSHIKMYGDYKYDENVINGFTYTGKHVMKNVFRYNLFEGGSMGIRHKAFQAFSGRTVENGYNDTYKEYGDDIHHNIFIGLNQSAIECNQDFLQVNRNIIYNCSGGIHISEPSKTMYKQMIYNNTVINAKTGGIFAFQGFDANVIQDKTPEPTYHEWVINNILDGCTYDDTYNKEEIAIVSQKNFHASSQADFIISNNYSYRPASHVNDRDGSRFVSIRKDGTVNRFTVSEWLTLRPGSELWMNNEDPVDPLYLGTSGAALFKTRGEHVLSGSTTIVNGGIGGAHPYLEGVALPSYIGATNPNDNAWVDGVLGLADLSNLKNGGPGDPWWVEGGSGNHLPVLAPIGNRSVPAGQQLQITVEATDADATDELQFSATGG